MNFRNLVIGAVAILSLAACSKSNDAPANASTGAPAIENPTVEGYNAGVPNFIFNVDSTALKVDGLDVTEVNDATFAGYPMLASEHADLLTVNKVIVTKNNELELWSADSILLALDIRGENPALMHSRSGLFQIESASWAMDSTGQGQGQGLSTGLLTINMRECMVEQKQDQGKQEETKPVDQGKSAPIDQGGQGFLSLVAESEGQGQGQGEEQGKPEGKPSEQCKTASFTYHLKEIEQPKEQDQGKPVDQGKPIDQGKEEGKPVDQGKEEGKPVDQGKPIDQGKEQGKP